MDLLLYTKYIVGLLFVLGLIALLAFVVRKMGFIPSAERPKLSKKRLGISQMIALDSKRRLLLIRRDDQEHLVILGPDGDTVVETNIQATPITDTHKAGDDTQDHDPDLNSDDNAAHTSEPRLPRLPVHHQNDETSS